MGFLYVRFFVSAWRWKPMLVGRIANKRQPIVCSSPDHRLPFLGLADAFRKNWTRLGNKYYYQAATIKTILFRRPNYRAPAKAFYARFYAPLFFSFGRTIVPRIVDRYENRYPRSDSFYSPSVPIFVIVFSRLPLRIFQHTAQWNSYWNVRETKVVWCGRWHRRNLTQGPALETTVDFECYVR